MEEEKDVNISNTHVPDKLYGYGLQIRQMMYELLNCTDDNSVVSVEKFDDVGVECSKGMEAIQTKSALSERNPVSDRASDLWKTLYNWLIALKTGELDFEHTKFKLVLNVNKTGSVVAEIGKADNESNALKAYNTINLLFLDEAGNYLEQSKSINQYIKSFFDINNKKYALKVIEKFELIILDKGHTEKIYDEFKQKTFLPTDIQELIFDKMLGWIEKITAKQIENKKVMQISRKEFKKELVLTQRLVNQNKCLLELASKPTDTEIKKEEMECKTYIKQLQIVGVEYDEQLTAINDYLKAATNRTIWAAKGDINEELMCQYYEDLKRRWKNKKTIVELDKNEWTEEKRGRYLYSLCEDDDVNIGALVTPMFFMNGCYHELSDKEEIGWHPNYTKKLRENDKNDK